jgi:hypothetical protein
MNPKIFPTIMIILCAISAINYTLVDWTDWRKILYWSAACALNIAVTY